MGRLGWKRVSVHGPAWTAQGSPKAEPSVGRGWTLLERPSWELTKLPALSSGFTHTVPSVPSALGNGRVSE